jgi:signal peptidase I
MFTLLRRIGIVLGVTGFVLCAGAVLLFNRPKLGWQLLSVPTGSMRPGMPPGSLVLTHRVPLSSLKVGDVITYTNPLTMHTTLTHRIIKEYKLDGKVPSFITKGDANPSPDPPVIGGLVQGIRAAHVPYAGYLFMWAKTWVGIAVLIYLPALLIMFEETRRLADALRRLKPYKLERFAFAHNIPLYRQKPVLAASMFAATLSVLVFSPVAGWTLADLTSNTVALTPNVLKIMVPVKPPPACGGNNWTSSNVSVNNSTNQNASGGNASNSNNTTVGITVNQTNC